MPALETSSNDPLITHLHWVAFARDIGIIIAGIVVPPVVVSVFMHNLLSGDVAVAIGHALPLLAALWMLLVWMLTALVWTKYYLSLWIITDKHLVFVNQANLFNRRVATWNIDAIQSVTASDTGDALAGTLDYGTVWIKTPEAGEGEYIAAEPIPHPGDVADAIIARLPDIPQRMAPLEASAKPELAENVAENTQAQEELIRSISHEMKGHLTRSQVTFASIIAGDFGAVPENLKNVAGAALADTREGVETVMNILNSANFKKGTLTFDKERFDLIAAVRESVDALRPDAQRKGVILRFKEPVDVCRIEGDRQKLVHHVFRNLIDNAIRYTPAGAIDVELVCDDASATFSVADTGVGIAPDDMQRLFTEGGKGAHSTQTNPQSTGYGLFVAKVVVEGHSGRIWAESEGHGSGSRFFVTLPMHHTRN